MSPHPQPQTSRFAHPPAPTRVRYIRVVQNNSAISHEHMLQELRQLQELIEQERQDSLRFFSGVYSKAGLFPRRLAPEEISERIARLVVVEAQYIRDSTTVKRFIKLMDYILQNGGHSR